MVHIGVSGWTGGRADGRTSGRADRWTSGRADKRTGGEVDGWTGGRVDGWTDDSWGCGFISSVLWGAGQGSWGGGDAGDVFCAGILPSFRRRK